MYIYYITCVGFFFKFSGSQGSEGQLLHVVLIVHYLSSQKRLASSEACISQLVVEKYVYLSKNGGHRVEVWDKKSGKMIDFIDCVQLLR